MPLYADRPASEHRLILAACLLHDVNWRAHPGLSRRALLRVGDAGEHRRGRPSRAGVPRAGAAQPLQGDRRRRRRCARYGWLLPPERTAEAAVLGRAMRLGAMLSGSATGVLEHASIAREGGRLVLTLRGPAREFAGEAVERRLQMLAARLDCPGRDGAGGLSDRAAGLASLERRQSKSGLLRQAASDFLPRLGPAPRVVSWAPVRARPCCAASACSEHHPLLRLARTKPASCTGCNAEITLNARLAAASERLVRGLSCRIREALPIRRGERRQRRRRSSAARRPATPASALREGRRVDPHRARAVPAPPAIRPDRAAASGRLGGAGQHRVVEVAVRRCSRDRRAARPRPAAATGSRPRPSATQPATTSGPAAAARAPRSRRSVPPGSASGRSPCRDPSPGAAAAAPGRAGGRGPRARARPSGAGAGGAVVVDQRDQHAIAELARDLRRDQPGGDARGSRAARRRRGRRAGGARGSGRPADGCGGLASGA